MRRNRLVLSALIALLAVPAAARADAPQAIDLQVTSDPGDAVNWAAAVTDATIVDETVAARDPGIVLTIPDTVGSVILQVRPPAGQALHAGTYPNANNNATAGPAPGLSVVRTGAPGTCLTATGSFTISTLDLIGSAVGRAKLTFEFHCNGGVTAVRGTLRLLAGLVEGTPDEGNTVGMAIDGDHVATTTVSAAGAWRVHYGSRTIKSPKPRENVIAHGLFGSTVVIQRFNNSSDLWFYSTKTRKFRKPPRHVNTKGWDFGGSTSAGYLQVVHGAVDVPGRKSIALVRLSNGVSRTIHQVTGTRFIDPGQVNGRYFAYDVCSPTGCQVYRYDRVARRRVAVAKPAGVPYAYDGAVAKDGTVYFVTSQQGCGAQAAVYAAKAGKAPARLLAIAPFDITRLQVGTFQGRPTLYGTRLDCGDDQGGDLVELPLQPLP